jgi:hypothetical protein
MESILVTSEAVTPEELVKAARRHESPIHHLFEWDNSRAAAKYRLEQARSIMRSVVVEVQEVETRAFRFVNTDGGKGYVPIQNAIKDVDLGQQLVTAALRALESWTVQYSVLCQITGLKPVFNAIERARALLAAAKEAKEAKATTQAKPEKKGTKGATKAAAKTAESPSTETHRRIVVTSVRNAAAAASAAKKKAA